MAWGVRACGDEAGHREDGSLLHPQEAVGTRRGHPQEQGQGDGGDGGGPIQGPPGIPLLLRYQRRQAHSRAATGLPRAAAVFGDLEEQGEGEGEQGEGEGEGEQGEGEGGNPLPEFAQI